MYIHGSTGNSRSYTYTVQVSLSTSSKPLTSSPVNLMPHLTYSLAWGMGGHLSQYNKVVFDKWWRQTFADPGLLPPASGLIWDYCPNPNAAGFVLCSSTNLALSSSLPDGSNTDSSPPFVSTSTADAVAHVVHGLISQGCPVLLVGGQGSGKTTLLQQVLSKIVTGDVTLQHIYASQVHVHTYWFV